MKKLLNEAGMSMVNVMMAAAMMGGLALVVTQLGKNSAQITSNASKSSDINEAFNRIEQLLLKSENCTETFSGEYFPLNTEVEIYNINAVTQIGATPVVKSFFEIPQPGAPDQSLIKIGKSSKVTTKNLTAKRISNDEIELKVAFNKGTDSKERVIQKTFNLRVKMNPDDSVESCFTHLENSVETACESLDGEMNGVDCKNTILHRGLCNAEVKIMQLTGTPGTTSCGVEYELETVSELKTSSGSFTIPNDIAGPVIEIKLLGAGGGGGGSDYNEPGGGGKSGARKSLAINVKAGDNCTYSIGQGGSGGSQGNGWGDSGSGGNSGGSTTITCGATTETASGGAGGCGECRGSGESCGWSAEDSNGSASGRVTFAGSNYGGGDRGCRKKDGNPGEEGVGGGGAGDRKQKGGKGGNGLVWFSYQKLKIK